MSKKSIKELRKERRKITAEDFTPKKLVDEMLDKLPEEVWEENKTFLDPACGNGNMVIRVLIRKIKEYKHNPKEALKSVYGTDIMSDNIRELHRRLACVLIKFGVEIDCEITEILLKNFVWTPLTKYPNGSLDYDFLFNRRIKKITIENYFNKLKKYNKVLK